MNGIQPQLWIDRAGDAVRFYGEAFGAIVLHLVGEGDEIVAQLAIDNDSCFWVARADGATGRISPATLKGATGRLLLVVDDPEAVVRSAVAAGAERCPGAGRARLAPRSRHRLLRTSGRSGDR
jgi:uncharacterized glyoxalase superfamily protein PhnB